MKCFVSILVLTALPFLAACQQQPARDGKFIYLKRATRAETKEASRAAIEASFGATQFKQSPWKYIGPFNNDGGRGLNTAFPPEVGIDLNATYTSATGKPMRWQDGSRFRDGDNNDLRVFDIYDYTLCYLYRTIESNRDQPATISVGSDDCITIWLNGTKVHEYRGIRGVMIDEEVVAVALRKGTNQLLMKVSNFATDYGFAYRLSQLDRRGLDELNIALKKLELQLDLDFPSPEADYYRLETVPIPPGITLEVGGLGNSPDGRMFICTRRGEIWLWRPGTSDWQLWASGLHEPLGILVEKSNQVLVAQRPELTRVTDTDGDGQADRFETVTAAFGLSGNFHEYHYGPVRDAAGNLYGTLNCGWNAFAVSESLFRGWAYQLTPAGQFIPYSLGFRSPVGIGISPQDEVFVTDSQGDWIPNSPLIHLQRGKFYGHPGSLRWTQGYNGPQNPHQLRPEQLEPLRTQPAGWFVHGQAGRAPGEPLWDTTGGKFGPFSGQMFVAEHTQSGVMRVALDKVGGEYQAAIFPFRWGFLSGPTRLIFAPDGSLYAGQTGRGWSSVGGRLYALQRVVWSGRVPMEIHSMKATPTGFDLTFTKPVDPKTVTNSAAWSLQHFHYHYYIHYGSPKVDPTPVAVKEVKVSADRRTVSLVLPALKEREVYELHVTGVKAEDGAELLHPEAYYTLNRAPK